MALSRTQSAAVAVAFAAVFVALVHASPNGLLYVCDLSSGYCVFTASDPEVPVAEHTITCDASDPAEQGKCAVLSPQGTMWAASPRPWSNGDTLSVVTGPVEQYEWNNVQIAQMLFPLRNLAMFHPETLLEGSNWDLYTRAYTDCGVKVEDETFGEVTGYSTTKIKAMISDPSSNPYVTGDIHHQVLQWLEEGAMDLVCLVTAANQEERCPRIRELRGLSTTDRTEVSDCWAAAYEAMFGLAPSVYGTIIPEESSATLPACTSSSIPLAVLSQVGVDATEVCVNQ